jgi:hypothetical protein
MEPTLNGELDQAAVLVLVTCFWLLKRLVPPCWAGHFLAERQKVTKKRVDCPAGGMSYRSVPGRFRTGLGFLTKLDCLPQGCTTVAGALE